MSVRVCCVRLCAYDVCLYWLKIKNLKLFSRFVWWLGRMLLTLHQETYK